MQLIGRRVPLGKTQAVGQGQQIDGTESQAERGDGHGPAQQAAALACPVGDQEGDRQDNQADAQREGVIAAAGSENHHHRQGGQRDG